MWVSISRHQSLALAGGLLGLTAALAAVGPAAPGGPAEIRRVHVLVVADTADDALRRGIEVDRRRVAALFRTGLPASQYTLTELTGEHITPAAMLARVRDLAPGPGDGVAVYYAGHGGRDRRGLFFAPGYRPGGPIRRLYRADVVSALRRHRAALTVLLSDCCSDPLATSRGLLPDPDPDAGAVREETVRGGNPNMRRLFLESRGLVDVTAATDDKAWGTDLRGGCFTFTVARLVGDWGAAVESWRDLVERVGRETPALHKDLVQRGLLERPERGAYQRPKAYALGDPPGGPGPGPQPRTQAYAVVSVRNPSAEPVTFRYRWTGGLSDWADVAVPPGGRECLSVAVPPGRPLPEFEIEMPDARGTYPARLWEGAGRPGYEDGRRYKVTPPKTVRPDPAGP